MRNSFVLYTSYREQIDLLTLEEKGMLLDALFQYVEGEEVELHGVVKMAFSFIKSQIDRDQEKYDVICEKRRNAGKLGGAPKGNSNASKGETSKNNQNQAKQANGYKNNQNKQMVSETSKTSKNNQNQAKQPDNDNDNVNDNENDNDIKEKEKVNEKESQRKLLEQNASELFEELWKLYPLKKGKNKVSMKQMIVLYKIGREQMIRCIERYKEYMSGKNPDYYAYGSSFFNHNYYDYLDENYSSSTPTQMSIEEEMAEFAAYLESKNDT